MYGLQNDVLHTPVLTRPRCATQNAGEDMIFETLEMNSKRLPEWVNAVKRILKIPIEEDD